MDKTIYKSHKKESKRKRKELKERYKITRSPLKERVNTVLNRAKNPFVVANKKIGNKIHKKRNDIRELNVKFDRIVNSLNATTDESRKKNIEAVANMAIESLEKLDL